MKKILSNFLGIRKAFFSLSAGLLFALSVFGQPLNNECGGATILVSGTACSNTAGTLINATKSLVVPAGSCGNANSPDVWYSFVAKSAYPTIGLNTVGANLITANPVIQLVGGSCGSPSQLACVTGVSLNVFTNYPTGLVIGTTYFIRVTTANLTGAVSTGTYTFNICVTDLAIDYSKSYRNITDGTAGGTINPGDVLEIRSTFVVTTGGSVTGLSYRDTLKANAGFRFKDSIASRTNEGKAFKTFTNAVGDDPGWYNILGPGLDTTIQINLGPNATSAFNGGGTVLNTTTPSFYGGTCIVMATYRVTVTGAYNTKINFGGGAFRFTASGVNYTISFPRDSLNVYETLVSCSDGVAPANLIGNAANGTFGTLLLGSTPTAALQNGGPAAINTTYGYQTFNGGNGPNDYYYGVANNTSSINIVNQILNKTSASSAGRVFGVWDITGDHTAAADQNKGNKPCDVSKPVTTTNPCGYLMAVNAAYRTDKVFEYAVTGACSETYYEVSAWFKNLCYKCGCDSIGRGSGTAGYIPTSPSDSSGVRPNIAMEIDGIDYYTTGELVYQGIGGTQTGSDTLNNWVRRSFVFKTSPTQTGFTITFRNNAPGGGGNDWAIDDIGLRTCYPTMIYAPPNPIIYMGSPLTISDTVRSYYNSYTFYKWQRKPAIPAASPWADLAGFSGSAIPVLNPVYNQFEYVRSYTIPGTATLAANAGDLYRMVVASSILNLNNGCNFSPDVSFTLLPTDAPCAYSDTNYAVAPQTGYIDWNKLEWSLGHVPTCCESAQITYTSSKVSADTITVNITNDICIINLTLLNKSTTANQIFKTILHPGYNMQMNGNVRMGAGASSSTDSCIFIAKGGGTITVNGNTVIGYPADNAFCIFGTAPATGIYAKYRLRGDSLTFNNRAITNPNYTSITIDPLSPATPVKITNNTGNYVASQLSFDSLIIGTTVNPAKAILLGTNPLAYTNDNIGGIEVEESSEFDMPTNTINAGGTFKSTFYLRANSLLKLGGGMNGIAGSNFPAGYALYNLAPTSTVQFYGAAQSIPGTSNNITAYGNITLAGTSVKTGSVSVINLAGDLYRKNGGHTYNANGGRVTFTSSINAQKYYTDAGATPIDFFDFTNNNTHASGLSIDSTMGILNELEIKTSTRTTLNTGDIIMRSSAARTSHVYNLGTTIPTIVYNGAYRFVIERYLYGEKSWRFLATPIDTATSPTIADAWRESQTALSSTGYGTNITGPNGPFGAGNQFDYYTQRGSMKHYNAVTNVWTEILTNTSTTKIANWPGYMVFVRGDRGAPNSTAGLGTPTNLRIKGRIRTGNQVFNILANKFQSIGNPFASQINFSALSRSNVTNSFIVWNPILPGLYGVGGYENYSIVGSDYRLNGTAGGAIRNMLESGEAFFVQNNTASAGTVIVKETDKGILSTMVSRTPSSDVSLPTVDISLFEKDATGNFILMDGASTTFDNAFSMGLDNDDVIKFTNNYDNLFIKSNNKKLVVERRPLPFVNDTIKLGLTDIRVADYRLRVDVHLFNFIQLDAYLVDKFLQTETLLNVSDSGNLNFAVTNVAASAATDRFMIIFKPLKTAGFNSIEVYRNEDKTATIKWKITTERNVENYFIEQSKDAINFTAIGTQAPLANNSTDISYSKIDMTASKAKNWYRVKTVSRAGVIFYSDVVTINEIVEPYISVYPNPVIGDKINLYLKYQPHGTYNIQVSNINGQITKTEKIKISSTNDLRIINLGRAVKGNYQMKVTSTAGINTTISLVVK